MREQHPKSNSTANNYFFRNTIYNDPDHPEKYGHVDEGDKSIYLLLKFLVEFLYNANINNKKIKDTCFFVNARDMPILKINEDLELEHPYQWTSSRQFIENGN